MMHYRLISNFLCNIHYCLEFKTRTATTQFLEKYVGVNDLSNVNSLRTWRIIPAVEVSEDIFCNTTASSGSRGHVTHSSEEGTYAKLAPFGTTFNLEPCRTP